MEGNALLTISATKIEPDFARHHDIDCALVDYSTLVAAERAGHDGTQGCTLVPEYAISIQPSEDEVIPIFLCKIHFNSLSLGLHSGVGVDERLFGKF